MPAADPMETTRPHLRWSKWLKAVLLSLIILNVLSFNPSQSQGQLGTGTPRLHVEVCLSILFIWATGKQVVQKKRQHDFTKSQQTSLILHEQHKHKHVLHQYTTQHKPILQFAGQLTFVFHESTI